jgi:predicted metal-dependent peptidase
VHADPAIVDSLSTAELGRLLVHLTTHLLRDHAGRAVAIGADDDGARGRWNRAADAEVNDDLAVDDCVPESAPDLPAALGCTDGRLAEAYFEDGEPGPRHWDCGSGCDGAPRPWDSEGMSRERAQLVAMGVAAEIERHHGLFPGTVPGGWLRWAERVLPSRVDWRRVLAAEIRRAVTVAAGKVDYTYRRPSRRASACPDVVLPSLVRPVPNVAVVCDTSGSMHDGLLARALAEVEGLLERAGLRQTQMRVLAVDTNVQAVRRVTRVSQVELAGGGGTNMGAGIAAAAVLRPRPSVIVVLTDGFTPWPAAPPQGARVVIGLLQQHAVPVGPFAAPSWARVVTIPDGA